MIALPTKYFGKPPYHVEQFALGACICRSDGVNCLSFVDDNNKVTGQKFTTLDKANRLCAEWNKHELYG
jgi:hypothetical protein